MVGGVGEKMTVRIAAEHADIWNGYGDPAEAGRLSRVLDDWCRRVGRNPEEIERSILLDDDQLDLLDDYVAQGITHFLTVADGPQYDLSNLEHLIHWRDSR
jgi:alkanesulfonate monooxygenase SsuD/methylene tetrahydromethanopterin reductase-like flavin-dependent oxidoreductase (luciferase family)